jgi:hypothetical protein
MLPLMRPLPQAPADVANADGGEQHDERFHGNGRASVDHASQSPGKMIAFKSALRRRMFSPKQGGSAIFFQACELLHIYPYESAACCNSPDGVSRFHIRGWQGR